MATVLTELHARLVAADCPDVRDLGHTMQPTGRQLAILGAFHSVLVQKSILLRIQLRIQPRMAHSELDSGLRNSVLLRPQRHEIVSNSIFQQ